MRALAIALLLLPCSGCFSVGLAELRSDPPVKRRYLLDVPVPAADAARQDGTVLLVPLAHAQSPYGGRAFVYRLGETEHATDFYNEFLVSPAEQISDTMRAWLRAKAIAENVVDTDSALVANRWLECDVTELRGDYREGQAKAALSIRATLLATQGGASHRVVIFTRDYTQTIEVADKEPESLVRGWSDALGKILVELARDITASHS